MARNVDLYKLICENISLVGTTGNPTSINWVKYFYTKQDAKDYAENHYFGKHDTKSKLKWSGRNPCHSQDLGDVMYNIIEVRVELPSSKL